jgi:hypothetical protein
MKHLHFAIANLGNGLNRCSRILENLSMNRVELDTRRDRLFCEAGNSGESNPLQQQASSHA